MFSSCIQLRAAGLFVPPWIRRCNTLTYGNTLLNIRYSRIQNIECIMVLKPQDVLFLLKLVALGRKPWTYNELAVQLGMSPSEVHAAAKRAVAADLAVQEDGEVRPNIRNLEEFLLHGLRYFSVPERGAKTRGTATLTSAPPFVEIFAPSDEISVWPDPQGDVRGEAFSPLYRSAPEAARKDPELYELLVIADALRGGRARERNLAAEMMKERLQAYG